MINNKLTWIGAAYMLLCGPTVLIHKMINDLIYEYIYIFRLAGSGSCYDYYSDRVGI